MMVPTSPQNSISVCQSRPLRGQPRCLDRKYGADPPPFTDRSQQALEPGRLMPPPERPRSSSMTSTWSSELQHDRQPVLTAAALRVVQELIAVDWRM